MKCPECVKDGNKSRVYEGYSTSTLMCNDSYYDEEGRYHFHNMNSSTTNYNCTNGHHFFIEHKPIWICCEPKETTE